MANIDDKFIKSVIAPPTKLSSSMSASSDVVAVESMDGWTSDTAVLAAIDRVDSLGNLTPDKMEIVLGVVSETGLSNVKRGIGGNVQSHSAGSVVELSIAGAEQWNRTMDALIGAFGQDGKLKESAFASGQQVVDGANIKDGSIEPGKLKIPFQIDFAASSGETITYTPKFDCSVIVEMSAHGWGYGGGLFIGEVSPASGTTVQTVGVLPFTVEGHDIVRKQLYSKGIFKGLKAGQQYIFSHKLLEGRRGGMGGFKFLITAIAE